MGLVPSSILYIKGSKRMKHVIMLYVKVISYNFIKTQNTYLVK